ncbi:TIGR00266 family protein [Vulcanisaeta souniana]|uniref:Transcriptional regulator n=2 Tax=Vulcanisaeta souniana JCM 11219 TaxID=1293586 RepID=A0ABM8BPJ0_9CREN|nr:TIGR00266 family protein [Vulcanisaeta souniana]BDR92787.1 transcriptional regulator [Vulcanisaeta souniana JCM 11219]
MVDFKIMGNDIQHLYIELSPGEKIYAEGGHLIWKSSSVNIKATTGGGLLSGLRRTITGASFFVLELEGPGAVDIAGFAPGRITEIDLSGNGIMVEHRAFLAMEPTVNYDIRLTGLGFGWLGGEGLLMARLQGNGRVFLHAIGDALMLELGPSDSIDVEAGHVLAFDEGMKVGIRRVGGLRTMLFGEEGLWLAHVEGPGRVWLRTLSRQQIIMGLMPELSRIARST